MDIENHPIPQDITGFQFKLIGSMTIKQFGYLAFGFIIAWVFYVSPLFFFIKIPLAVLAAIIGASLAFLPIDGRPLDLMIVNLIKAITKPTQYVYQQAPAGVPDEETKSLKDFNKKRQSISDMSDQQLQVFLKTLPKARNKLDQKEMVFIQNISQYQNSATAQKLPNYVPRHAFAAQEPQQAIPTITQPAQNTLPPVDKPAVQPAMAKPNTTQIAPPQQTTTVQPAQAAQDTKQFLETHQKMLELQQSLSDMQLQKQQLEERLIQIQKQVQIQQQPAAVSPQIAQQEPEESKLIRSIPQNMTKKIGLITTPEFPNVISGIIKDPRGNPLPNILVEIKDLQGNAIRAFKTNALGQFASATALTNGEFTMEFEDPRGQNKFETVGFKATGEIIMPLEIISIDSREELRRSLFN